MRRVVVVVVVLGVVVVVVVVIGMFHILLLELGDGGILDGPYHRQIGKAEEN